LVQGNKALLMRYVYYGDGNLDGTVDLTDFTYLAANFNSNVSAAPGTAWLFGDYNYDGNVDLTDFTFLASNFNQTLAAGSPGSIGSVVPEPVTLSSIALMSAGLLRRRRR
jgi:hypothetical protein